MQEEYSTADVMRLFVSIQALIMYIEHDGQAEITRNGHSIAVRNIEGFLGTTFPRNGRGQRLRRERIALVNALILHESLGQEAPDRWPSIFQVADQIEGEFPCLQFD